MSSAKEGPGLCLFDVHSLIRLEFGNSAQEARRLNIGATCGSSFFIAHLVHRHRSAQLRSHLHGAHSFLSWPYRGRERYLRDGVDLVAGFLSQTRIVTRRWQVTAHSIVAASRCQDFVEQVWEGVKPQRRHGRSPLPPRRFRQSKRRQRFRGRSIAQPGLSLGEIVPMELPTSAHIRAGGAPRRVHAGTHHATFRR